MQLNLPEASTGLFLVRKNFHRKFRRTLLDFNFFGDIINLGLFGVLSRLFVLFRETYIAVG